MQDIAVSVMDKIITPIPIQVSELHPTARANESPIFGTLKCGVINQKYRFSTVFRRPRPGSNRQPTDSKIKKGGIISINRGRLGRGAEDVSLKNQELMS